MRRFLSQLAYALRHVGNEYRSAALVGSNDYSVRVQIVGLEREESARVFARVAKEALSSEPPERNDDLAAKKVSYVDATVVKAAGPFAATTIVMDSVRDALGEERLEHKVVSLTTAAVLEDPQGV